MRDIEKLEHQSRRTDVMVDDSLIEAFYDTVLPEGIFNGAAFEKWHKEAIRDNPKCLFLNREDLMRHEAAGITTDLFPKTLRLAGIDMSVTYHFEPGSVRDGVTLTVPIYALNQLEAERCDWLVPGMLKEKVQLLIKSLPQKLRRSCVPLPDYAAGFFDRIVENNAFGKGALTDVLIQDIRERNNVIIKKEDFRPETLPPHLFLNIRVVDEHGRTLDVSRNLATLQNEFGYQARQAFQQLANRSSSPKKKAFPLVMTLPQIHRKTNYPSCSRRKKSFPGSSTRCRNGWKSHEANNH